MKTISELYAAKEVENSKTYPVLVTVGIATCGLAAGAGPVIDKLKELKASLEAEQEMLEGNLESEKEKKNDRQSSSPQ